MLSSERRSAVVHDGHIGFVSEIAISILIASNDKRDTGYTGTIDNFEVKIHRHDIAEKNKEKTEPELTGKGCYLPWPRINFFPLRGRELQELPWWVFLNLALETWAPGLELAAIWINYWKIIEVVDVQLI